MLGDLSLRARLQLIPMSLEEGSLLLRAMWYTRSIARCAAASRSLRTSIEWSRLIASSIIAGVIKAETWPARSCITSCSTRRVPQLGLNPSQFIFGSPKTVQFILMNACDGLLVVRTC